MGRIQQNSGPWHIRLFGSVEVESPAGLIISVPGKKTGELLAYLALHPSRAHSREKLVDLIWGDSEVGDARTRLRQEILKLRSLLASPNDDSLPLLITKDSCQMAPGTIVDAVRFEISCLQASRDTDFDSKRRLYQDAIPLYTSDLLPVYDASWILSERARLSQCYSRAMFDLAETLRQMKDYAGAEASLGTLLRHDPLSEECHIALMRLYAELGQPTRVQQQLQAMERALRDGLGVEPTSGSLKLGEELREEAGLRAAVTLGQGEDSVTIPPRSSGMAPQRIPAARHNSSRTRIWRTAAVIVVALVLIAGTMRLRAHHSASVSATPIRTKVLRHQETWAYYYQPRAGEKPNSEGRAIVVDQSGIYVTGLVQTLKDDADILTLKLSPEGRLLWADRYSSPEHDCDRAFSICLDEHGGIFVAGETYVPEHSADTEGWRLVLLHYDGAGHRLWVKRSPMVVHTEGECIQVLSDRHGGCYLGGTALESGTQNATVLRYNGAGRLIWHTPFHVGLRTVFSRFAIDASGMVYVCGTMRKRQGYSAVCDKWLVACIDQLGHLKWTHHEDGPTDGNGSAARIFIDPGGDVLVAGVQDADGAPPNSEPGFRMVVRKYAANGDRLWQQVVNDSGPAVTVDGFAINDFGDVIVGGTERRLDGKWDVVLARYDSFGHLALCRRYQSSGGNNSAALSAAFLDGSEGIIAVSQVCSGAGISMRDESSVHVLGYGSDGTLNHEWHESAPQALNIARDSILDPSLILTGQRGTANGPRALMVLRY